MAPEEIRGKVEFLRENLSALDRLPQSSFEEFASDFRNLDSALHRLQTSIQALIDLGSYLVAQRGLAIPTTSRAIVDELEGAGVLPPGSADRFGPLFGFRNRVVHLYDRIDPRIVYRILHEDRADLAELLRLFLDALEANGNQG